jgi:predicted restriction endonuclease
MAAHLNRRLGPAMLRCESDVQGIAAAVSQTQFNKRHRSNFRSVLRKYVAMVRSNFEGLFDGVSAPAIDVNPNELPPRIRTEISRVVRDTVLTRRLKREYAGQCQICGKKLELGPNEYYVEAHHLKPLGQEHSGPDVELNIVCVCPNCHVLLDYGALKIGPKTLKVCLHQVGKEFLDYHNDRCQR